MTSHQDPRPHLFRSIAIATDTMAAVRPDQYDLPTPCAEFTVGDLLAHLVFALDRFAIAGAFGEHPPVTSDKADLNGAEPLVRWLEHAGRVAAIWSDDSLLGAMVDVEWTQMPGAAAAAMYTSEFTVHAWDLARATGLQPRWSDDVCEFSLAAMQIGLPDSMPRTAEVPFATKGVVSDDAPAIDRLVAWTGRQP